MLIVNKSDLGSDALEAELADVSRPGPCLPRSGRRSDRRRASPTCAAALAGGATLLVGQSGVGKSSHHQCASARGGGADRRAHARRRGPAHDDHRALVPLGDWGYQLGHRRCSGGARFRASGEHRARRRARLRRDPRTSARNCRFKDCRHMEEPGCAVRGAVIDRAHRGATLRKLPPALPLVREARAREPGKRGGQETLVRPARACASVPPSTYSSSPPTGTPWAMREALRPKRSARSPR